jgi:hypothetical protein
MEVAQLACDRDPRIETFGFQQSLVRAFQIASRYVKAGKRQTLLSSLITPPGINQYLAQLLAQPDVAGRIIYNPFERLYCAIEHAVFDQQLSIDYRALWIEIS